MNVITVSNNQHTYQVKSVAKGGHYKSDSNLASDKSSVVNHSLEGAKLADEFQQNARSTIYDKPDFKTGIAISTYREINNQQRRADVEALIGVNIYA